MTIGLPAGPAGASAPGTALGSPAGSAAQPVSRPDFSRLRGANYVPSYARNDVQTWMDYNPTVIERELGFAQRLDLNCVRVFLQFAVYERDPQHFLQHFEDFLRRCDQHHLQMMPVLFDSCFGEFPDLTHYRDKDWMACPGQDRLGAEHWPKLERYVRDVVGGHRDDRRIVAWDVMNEPTCTRFYKDAADKERIHAFLRHFLDYAKAQGPTQPRTVGLMSSSELPLVLDQVDVLGFHNYTLGLRDDIRRVQALGREHGKPALINEVVRRPEQPFPFAMPILREEGIGWAFWELMLGKTEFTREPNPIQGLIYADGTCRDPREVAAVRNTTVEQARQLFPERSRALRKLLDTPLRDPSICRGPDGTWYLTGTVEPFWGSNQGIKLWKSPDFTNWTAMGFVWKCGDSPWHKKFLAAKKPLWAPEIHYLKGTFWLTYSMPGWDGTAKTSGSGLLKSTTGKPEGPYADMQPAERLGDEIDASLFEDDDDGVYFLWHSGKIARLKPDMSGLAEPYRWLKTTVSDPDPNHHSGLCAGIFGKGSFDHVGYEGMFLFKREGRYYLCCSENFEGRYSCAIATATNLFGPYGGRYEALPHAGHNTFFRDDRGQWWSTYFGSDDTAPWQERPGVLPVEFDAQGRVLPKNP